MLEKSYIDEYGTVDDINTLVSDKFSSGTMILTYSDKFICDTLDAISDTEHLLEARIFSETAELKIMRPTIADSFSYRFIDDNSTTEKDYIEEIHYLDIDKENSSGNIYTATGGGKYTLPIENAERIVIRNYVSYDNQGIAQITDFRVVKFLKRGEE